MRMFFERSKGACIKITAIAETKTDISAFLFAIEGCRVEGLSATIEYAGSDFRRIRHLIASRGLLDRVRAVGAGEPFLISPSSEHFVFEGGRSAFGIADGIKSLSSPSP